MEDRGQDGRGGADRISRAGAGAGGAGAGAEAVGDAEAGLDGQALLSALAGWGADLRTDVAARARTRERSLRRQAEEEATLAGAVLDLAERRTPVVLRTTTGRTHRGPLVGLGRDFCVVRSNGATTLVALSAVAVLRPPRQLRGDDVTGDRQSPLDVSMAAVLASLAPERPRVLVVPTGAGDGLAGELRAVGRDVLALRLDADPPTTVYVGLASVTELSLLGSG